jgi:uncharacterized membrane protein YkvA (DUF1232 family)
VVCRCRGERHLEMQLFSWPIRRRLSRSMAILTRLRERARHLKAETFALYLAARHAGTPWYAKLMVAAIVAYALSPIDLIPDFVPILGYLDDLVLIPLGVALAIKMIPPAVISECRARAREVIASGKPVSHVAGALIVLIWLVVVGLLAIWTYEAFASMDTQTRASSPDFPKR